MTTWTEQFRKQWHEQQGEQFRAEGRAEGLAEGLTEGRLTQLVSMARQRFGEASASTMAALLGPVPSEAVLDEVGTWLLTCSSGDALIAKIREI